MISVGFMMENIFVAARAKGLGTVPTVFQWFVEDEFRALLDIPAEVEVPLVTPLGYPVEFPVGPPPRPRRDPPALADARARRRLGEPPGLISGGRLMTSAR